MELETATVPLVEILPNARSVRVQVVPDHMDDLLRPSQGDLVHECQEVGLGARVAATGNAAPCMNVQGCKESLGAMADVFKFDPPGSPSARSSIPLLTLGDLNPRLFVDGQNHGPPRFCMVKVANDIDLRSEIRVWAVQPLLHMMRVQISGLKDPMDLASADLGDNSAPNRSFNKLVEGWGSTATPVGGLTRQRNHLEPLGFLNTPGASRARLLFQTINPETGNPSTPETHGLDRGMERIRNGFGGIAFRGHQGDPSTEYIALSACVSAHQGFQGSLPLCRKRNRLSRTSATHAMKDLAYLANYSSYFRDVALVAVVVGLVRALLRHADVVGLLVGQLGQLGVELLQLQPGHLLVQVLGQGVDADRVLAVGWSTARSGPGSGWRRRSSSRRRGGRWRSPGSPAGPWPAG